VKREKFTTARSGQKSKNEKKMKFKNRARGGGWGKSSREGDKANGESKSRMPPNWEEQKETNSLTTFWERRDEV